MTKCIFLRSMKGGSESYIKKDETRKENKIEGVNFMGFKKLISTLMVCGLMVTSFADINVRKPVDVEAADASNVFNSVTLAKGYKNISYNNPCQTQRFSADPGVMEYNGRVYVYATNDGDVTSGNASKNSYGQITKLNCMSSADLVNWTDHGTINVARSGGAASWAGNSWAPCAAHKTINGKEKFFLYFANNANGIGVLTADSPTGPWRDPIGKALISRSTPNCGGDSVTWLFDPAVLVDTDGTGYLYFGGGVPTGKASNPKTARVVKLGADMTSLAGTPQTIDAPWIFEDSGINKIGNTYYYSYCTNWSGGPLGNARIAYMTSNSPMGPFTSKGVCFKNQGEFLGDGGNNHHTIIPFKNKYYIFYHSETLNKQVYGSCLGYRTTFVNEMPYSNGTLGQAKATLQGVAQVQNLNPYVSNRAATIAWQGGILVNGSGANTIVSYNRGDWTGVSGVAFGNSGATAITMKAASQNGAVIKICDGSASGTAIGYVTIPATGSNNTYKTVTANINKVTGTKKVFFVASGDVNVDSWQFSTNGTVPSISPSVKPSVAPAELKEGWYYIKNILSEKYLQVTNNDGKAGANVEISTGTGVAGQRWYLKNTENGYFTLTSGLGNFMIDVANGVDEDGANIQIYNAYSGNAQQFILQPTGTSNIYTIGTKASNGTKVLDVYNHGKEDGTNVCQWTKYGAPNQQFIFEAISATPSTAPSVTPSVVPSVKPSTAPSVAPSKIPSGTTGLPAGVTCEYSIVSDWGSGFQGKIVLSNKSSHTFNGWTLSFDYNNTITSLWGAELASQTGTKVVVKNPSWDATLAPGGTVTINFVVNAGSDKNAPMNYSLE